MMKLLLIDASFILWKCVPAKIQTADEVAQYGSQQERTFEQVCTEIDNYLTNKIFIPTDASYYLGFLDGEGNFRKQISSDYKANRIGKELPKYFWEAKQYLIDKWKFVKVDGIEAEDAVGITLLNEVFNSVDNVFHRSDFEIIIVSQDHDLKQLPGTHYNPVKGEWNTISREEADYNFWKQMLTGCSTDKVRGIPKVGEKTAHKILHEDDDKVIRWNLAGLVAKAYDKYFGAEKSSEEFAKNYHLLKILRDKDDFVVPEIQSVNKSVEQQIIPEF